MSYFLLGLMKLMVDSQKMNQRGFYFICQFICQGQYSAHYDIHTITVNARTSSVDVLHKGLQPVGSLEPQSPGSGVIDQLFHSFVSYNFQKIVCISYLIKQTHLNLHFVTFCFDNLAIYFNSDMLNQSMIHQFIWKKPFR